MSPVGGSRFYTGGGLGDPGAWKCPACGAENLGPIEQGCQLCGSGKPGRRAEPPPPPPRVSERPPDDPTYDQVRQVQQGDVADYWASQHPEATLAEAYRMGYLDGVRAARQAQPEASGDKTRRTIAAALALFRDQVLAGNPEEVSTGEWLSAEEVDRLIAQLTEREVVHA
jgi:hypothetical protein